MTDAASPPLLCVAGDLVEDVVVWAAAPVVVGTDNPAVVHRARGGSAANVAAFAAPLVATRFVGCVGDDPLGDVLAQALAGTGAEVRVQRRGRTGSVVVVVEAGGERTMFPDRGAAAELDRSALDWMAGVDVLHVPAYALGGGATAATVVALAGGVRQAGGRVTVDASAASLVRAVGAGTFRAWLAEMGATLLFANADEAAALALDGEPLPAGCTAIVKDGPRPVRILAAGRPPVEVPSVPVERVVDTTGAGDAFAAGTLAAWLHGAPLADACAAGGRLAAAVLTSPGATLDAPAPTDLAGARHAR